MSKTMAAINYIRCHPGALVAEVEAATGACNLSARLAPYVKDGRITVRKVRIASSHRPVNGYELSGKPLRVRLGRKPGKKETRRAPVVSVKTPPSYMKQLALERMRALHCGN